MQCLDNSKPSGPAPYVWDPDALIYFDAADTAGAPIDDIYKVAYNELFLELKAQNQWDEMDVFYLQMQQLRTQAKIDLKRPTVQITTSQDYGGDFVTFKGFKGNGTPTTGFRYQPNFNPTVNGIKFTRNDASLHLLVNAPNTNLQGHDVGTFNAGFTQGSFIRAQKNNTKNIINSLYPPTQIYVKNLFQSNGWISAVRTSSSVSKTYYNGVLIEDQTNASAALLNQDFGCLGAFNGSFLAGDFHSTAAHGALIMGSSLVNQSVIRKIINSFAASVGASFGNLNKNIIFEGDSRTGSEASPFYSVDSAYPLRALNQLGSQYAGAQIAEINETVVNMIAQYPTEASPFFITGLTNYMVIWAGTNDIGISGRTGSQVHADLITLGNLAKADGFTVIIIGEIDRTWPNQSVMNGYRSDLRTLMLADFTNALSSNIYEPNTGITYVAG